MKDSPSSNRKTLRIEKPRLIVVSVGMLFFAVGFFVTLAAVQSNHATVSSNGAPSQGEKTGSSVPESIYLLSGILISLAGLALATYGPIVGMVRGKG